MNKEAIEYFSNYFPSVKSFCNPLNNHLGISLFIYFKIYHDSTYITLSNDINLTQEYCMNVKKDNIYFQRYLENNSKNRIILWPKEPNNVGTQLIFNRNYWNGISILRINDDNIEGSSFSSHVNNPRVIEFFLQYSKILEKFSEYFKFTFAEAISKCNQHKARFTEGFDFYLPQCEEKQLPDIKGFLETTGIGGEEVTINGKTIGLTLRECQCLDLMNQGYTLKEIGKELLLSHRTIETYINNIKNKTGLYFKSDLFQLYYDFVSKNIPQNSNNGDYHE